MNKEKRLERHLKNKEHDKSYKEEAWEDGKLIEPNHNNGPYPADYSLELGTRLESRMKMYKNNILQNPTSESSNDRALEKFRLYRQKIRDFLLHYNPNIEKSESYMYLINAYETYQDTPEKLIEVL